MHCLNLKTNQIFFYILAIAFVIKCQAQTRWHAFQNIVLMSLSKTNFNYNVLNAFNPMTSRNFFSNLTYVALVSFPAITATKLEGLWSSVVGAMFTLQQPLMIFGYN